MPALNETVDTITDYASAKKPNHQANIVRIKEILPHPDPATLNLDLIHIGQYQVVVRKGEHSVGEFAIYIQPDSVVPQTEPFRFIWEPYQVEGSSEVPAKRRRITVRRFRGEYSEGLLMRLDGVNFPALDDYLTQRNLWDKAEGMDVSDLIGVTHYDPDAEKEQTNQTYGISGAGPKRKHPKTLKGWFFFLLYHVFGRFGFGHKNYFESVRINVPEYDVQSLKNHGGVFKEGEMVVVSEKIHGSSARYTCIDGVMYVGSRTKWKTPNSPCIWRKALKQNPWIESWCRAHEGYTLYGEVIPTQNGYNYGCAPGEVKFLLFDIRTPDGKWVSYEDYWFAQEDVLELDKFLHQDAYVPVVMYGAFNEKMLRTLADGPSLVPFTKHRREGVVIKPTRERTARGLGRVILKLVGNEFLAKDNK